MMLLRSSLGALTTNSRSSEAVAWVTMKCVLAVQFLFVLIVNFLQKVAETVDILDCDQPRYFWVSWYNGNIEAGRGSRPGTETILSWLDPDPHAVAMVAVSSGFGASASWLIAEYFGIEPFRPMAPISGEHPLFRRCLYCSQLRSCRRSFRLPLGSQRSRVWIRCALMRKCCYPVVSRLPKHRGL